MEPQLVERYINDINSIPVHHQRLMKQWRDVYYGMSLHTTGACPRYRDMRHGWITPACYFGEQYQELFENYYFSRHPREHEETRWWRFSQYKPLTRAAFLQIIEVISGSLFQDSNYTIDIQDDSDNSFVFGNNFEGYDLLGWFANIGLQSIMEDPNGLLVRMPAMPFYEQTGEKVQVGIYFVNSKDIVYYDGETVIFCLKGFLYYIDDTVIYRYSKNGEGKWFLGGDDADGYYSHLFGRLPVDVAGGVWNSQGFYDSYLVKAKAVADDFISSYSGEQMIDKEASHPWITMANEKCGECRGIGQVQRDCGECPGGFEVVNCDRCHGSGTTSVSPGDRLNAPISEMDKDLIKITNPDININKYHHDKTNDIYDKILSALYLYKTDKAESGTAKAIDEERLYQFFSRIGNHIFDKLLHNTIVDFIAYRNVSVDNGTISPANYDFFIGKPTQYQIKTSMDLLDEFKMGVDSNVPSFIRAKMMCDLVDKKYGGDMVMRKKSEIIIEMDKLSLYSQDELLTMRTMGSITADDISFSLNLPSVLESIIRQKGQEYFIKSGYDTIRADVGFFVNKGKQPILYNDGGKTGDN